MTHINRVIYLLYTEGDKTHVDLFTRAPIGDFDYAKGDAERYTKTIKSNKRKKFRLVIRDVKNSITYKESGDKVLTKKRIHTWDEARFKDCGKFEVKPGLVNKIKSIFLSDRLYPKIYEFNTGLSDDDESGTELKECKMIIQPSNSLIDYSNTQQQIPHFFPEINLSPKVNDFPIPHQQSVLLKHDDPSVKTGFDNVKQTIIITSNIEDNSSLKFTSEEQNEIDITEKMLQKMGFLKPGEYYISGKFAWLYKPFGHAYGDILLGQKKPFYYQRDGWMFEGITRLSESDYHKYH